MAKIIEMPKLSDTMEEGGIASWLKEEGEFIEDGDAFVEIETDKATMEYNSPEEGYLLKILVEAGSSCALSAPICVLGEKGEKVDVNALLAASGGEAKAETPPTAEAPAAAPAPAQAPAPAPAASSGGRSLASPLARKVAQEKGLDISTIQGSGPGGRVVLRDVESAEASPASAPAPTTASAPAASAPQSSPLAESSEDEIIPLTMMRKTIAKRLLAGKNEAPHFYLTRSVNMEKLMAWRKELNAEAEASGGKIPRVSVNDCIILATARALIKHPEVNASWQGDHIRRYSRTHMAVAVALPEGLVTPVVRNAHALGVRAIATATKDLVKRAKDGNLTPDEYQGGTFTISNLGMMGIEEFTAIINPPQAAILALGATIKTPWVNDNNQVIVQPRMKMTMSCDHRVVDGAMGAEFLQTLAMYLENPMRILS